MLNGAFGQYLNGILELMFLKFELLRKLKKQWREMVHSGPLWNNVLEFGTAEKKLKARGNNDALWKQLKGEGVGRMVHSDTSWKDGLEVEIFR